MKTLTKCIIEIQPGQLKVLFGFSTADQWTVSTAKIIDSHGLSDDDISKKLVQLFVAERIRLDRTDITIVIPRNEVLVRYLLLPSHREDEIQQMVGVQIFKHIPFGKEEVVIGHEVIVKDASGYAKVVVFVVEWELALRLWRICSSAGAWAQHMTVGSLCLPFLFTKIPSSSTAGIDACILVDKDRTEFCLCLEGKLIFSRAFQVELVNGELNLEEWVSQLEASLRQYGKDYNASPMSRFFVIAELALCPVLATTLSAHFQTAVETFANHKEVLAAEGLTEPSLATVYAVAREGKNHSLNLIPWEAKSAKLKKEIRFHSIRIAALLMIVISAAFFSTNVVSIKRNWYLAQLKGEIRKSQSKIKALKPKLQAMDSIDAFITGRLILADVIVNLNRLLPPTTSLTMLNVNSERVVVLQGISSRTSDVSIFQKVLLGSGLFNNIKIDYVNKTMGPQGEIFVFQLTCQITKSSS
jgi:hypothetical protein